MDWLLVLRIICTAVLVVGAVGVVLGLPGTFVAWLGVLLFVLFGRLLAPPSGLLSGWLVLGTFFGSVAIELADNVLSGILVRTFGASTSSILVAWLGGIGGGVLGGLLGGMGGFLGSAVLGLVGVFAGGYAAVYAWERYHLRRSPRDAARAAFGTVLGRLVGMALKLLWIAWLLSLLW